MNYIPRTLIYYDDNLNQITIKDDELLNLNHSVVILAEPGMGKSRLLDYLETADNTVKFTASSFVRKPAKLLQDIKDKIVLIDALDEYQGRADSNTIDDILNKLFELNNPKFILRNYLLFQCIEEMNKGNDEMFNKLWRAIQNPYTTVFEEFETKTPQWATQKPGCSMLSCSS